MGVSKGEMLRDPPGTQALSTDASPDRTKEAKTIACQIENYVFQTYKGTAIDCLIKKNKLNSQPRK